MPMDKKTISPFQIGIYVVFGLAIVFAVLIFSGKIPIGKSSTTSLTGTVTIWGTLPFAGMQAVTDELRTTYKGITIIYTQEDPDTFQSDLVNALASGVGPDMIFITPADVVPNQARLFEIPYASFPQATFQNAFVNEGNLFTTPTGVLALPFSIDPLIMYYNRDMLTSSFTVNPPRTWDDVVALNQKITQEDNAGKLSTETVALGTYDNITNAKAIISALIFQTGNPIVTFDQTQNQYLSTFAQTDGNGNSGVVNAVTFYTDFANAADTAHYSWNPTLQNDKREFVAGNLALYFGYASELAGIRQLNPNLNFDIAMLPQRASVPTKVTYGQMEGIAILKLSKNIPLDVTVAEAIAGKPAVTAYLTADPTVTPARTDMLSGTTSDARQTIIYDSAIIAQSWLDPDPTQTSALFGTYIRQINAGTAQPDAILAPVDSLLTSILNKIQSQTSAAATTSS
jgi:ABC-type glycerol-3-phosphate transport system substrate-binding protein